MGIPTHYSQDLPDRCLQLIRSLWPAVQEVRAEGQEHLGPLTTTFLLAMANPILVLPIERIERHRGKEIGGYVNDRPLDRGLAEEVDRVLGSGPLNGCPFFVPRHWRYSSIPFKHQNFALEFPWALKEQLDQDAALDAAAQLPASKWASCLRNALSHGGVSYLDAYGLANHGGETEMLAFVCAKYPKYPKGHLLQGRRDSSQPPEALEVLRIAEADFGTFLTLWVRWLKESGFSRALAKAA